MGVRVNEEHTIGMRPFDYPGKLRLFECEECSFAFFALVDHKDVVKIETVAIINNGVAATIQHSVIHEPNKLLDISLRRVE